MEKFKDILKSMRGVFLPKQENDEYKDILSLDSHFNYKSIADSKKEMADDLKRFSRDFRNATIEAKHKFNPA